MITAVLGGVLSAVTQLLGFFVNLAGSLTNLFLGLAVKTLDAVISGGLVSLSYTNPATNPFIATGWELTRGLTNIIFVLALLAIGLGTALKMNDYQAKKTLPLLIIIALLINFTPVILGVIVDAANIVMNYFLSSGFQGGNVFLSQAGEMWSIWASGLGDFFNPKVALPNFMALLILNFFNVIAAFIFFIFAAIFLMRYVIIWLLVILSPIAFASYILPATRGIFKKWWTQFLQWTFVGVTAGFFLYLANQLIKLVLIDKAVISSGQRDIGLLNIIFNSVLPWGVIIIFLILGLQAAMSSSAQGANLAINFAKKGGKLAGGFAGKKAMGFIREKMPEGARKWMERQATAPTLGAGIKGPLGKVVRGLASPLSMARRGGGSILTAALSEKGDAIKAAEAASKRDVIGNLGAYRSATVTEAEREGIIRTMIVKKQLKDAMNADIVGDKNVFKDEEIAKAYKKAVQFRDEDTQEGLERATISAALKGVGKIQEDAQGNLVDGQGHRVDNERDKNRIDEKGNKILLSTEFAKMIQEATKTYKDEDDRADENGLTQKDRDRSYTSYAAKIVGEAKTVDELKQLKRGWWNTPELMESAHRFWGGHQIGEAARTFGRGFSDKFQGFSQDKGLDWYFEIDEIVDKKTGKKSYKTRNPDVPKYLTGTGALVLGMGIPGVTTTEVDQRTTESRILERNPIVGNYIRGQRDIEKLTKDLNQYRLEKTPETADLVRDMEEKLNEKIAADRQLKTEIDNNENLKGILEKVEAIKRQPTGKKPKTR